MALSSASSKNKTKTALKKFISKKSFSFISGNGTFLYFLKNVSLIFPEMEFSSLKNKKFEEGTSELEKIKKPTLKKILIFREMELFSPKLKNLLYFF